MFQVVALSESGQTLGASLPRTITVSEFDSFPPVVNYYDPGFDSMTTTSKMRVAGFGSDEDGTMVGMQFYLDGFPLGEEILRRRDSENLSTPLSSNILSLASRSTSRYTTQSGVRLRQQQLCNQPGLL